MSFVILPTWTSASSLSQRPFMPTCNKMSPGLRNCPVNSNTLANGIHQKISRVINTCLCVSGLEGMRVTNKRPVFFRSTEYEGRVFGSTSCCWCFRARFRNRCLPLPRSCPYRGSPYLETNLGGRRKAQAFQSDGGQLSWTPLVLELLARLAKALSGLHHEAASPSAPSCLHPFLSQVMTPDK